METLLPTGVDVAPGWSLACPVCRSALAIDECDARCAQCKRVYVRASGIWRLLPQERLTRYEQFLCEYHAVRADQGWGRPDAAYFVALPHVAPDDPQWEIWRRRAKSYRLLLAKIVAPLAAQRERSLRILDLGAGNCWLAYRLTEQGQQVAAIDLSADALDGLGAHTWYGPRLASMGRAAFTPLQAEFDRLPLPDRRVDVAIFNASLHYATDCAVTLREALRVLSADGIVVIMDSPLYRQVGSGQQMVRERETAFERAYGFRSNSVPAEQFLTTDRLAGLARELSLQWQMYGTAGRVSRLKGRWRRLRGRRELATMPVVLGRRV